MPSKTSHEDYKFPAATAVRVVLLQAEMKDEDAVAVPPGRTMQESLAAKLPAGLSDDSERDDVRPSGRWSIPAAPNPCGGEAVKMGRHEAWARFLAYEVCSADLQCMFALYVREPGPSMSAWPANPMPAWIPGIFVHMSNHAGAAVGMVFCMRLVQ